MANPRENQWMEHVGIKVNANGLPDTAIDKLIEIVVDTSLHLPSMFVLRFHDDGYALMDSDTFKLGAAVTITLSGGNGKLLPVIVGEITALEPEYLEDRTAVLTVRGYDRSHRLNRGTKTRVFVNTTDQEIVEKIAREADLSVQSDATPGDYDHIFQDNQSDLAFLQGRAQRIGFEVYVDDRVLHFRKPGKERGEIMKVAWGSELRSFFPRLTLSRQVDKVIVKGWDPAIKKEIIGEATRSILAPKIAAWQNGGGPVAAEALSPGANQMVVRRPVAKQDDADAVAQAILDEINAGFVEAEGVAYGNPELVAGKKLDITNLGKRFSGTYVVTSAVHVYRQDGYEVHFRVEGARTRLMSDLITQAKPSSDSSPWGGVVPAVVTNNNDPDGMSRVKLKYPWMDNELESDWARVAGVGAGADRGMYWLPEINDEVLVAFEHGDFGRPYVVGNLWNGKDAPPESIGTAVKNGKVETRTIRSRTGHIIRMVDESSGQKLEIIDASGKCKLILDSKSSKITVECSGDVVIDSKGKVDIKAAAEMSLQSQGNLTVQASGNLTLRGAMVNIN